MECLFVHVFDRSKKPKFKCQGNNGSFSSESAPDDGIFFEVGYISVLILKVNGYQDLCVVQS